MEAKSTLNAEFKNALLNIDRIGAAEIFRQGLCAETILQRIDDLIVVSLEQIGEGFERQVYSLAQVYMSAILCEELLDTYLPKMVKPKALPTVAIGVLLDHHTLGKRIVYAILRSNGYEPIDLGQGLSVDELVEGAIRSQAEVLLISTLLLPSALKIRAVRTRLDEQGVSMKIIAGGAPFRMDSQLWKTVKADGSGASATDVIGIIERVVQSS